MAIATAHSETWPTLATQLIINCRRRALVDALASDADSATMPGLVARLRDLQEKNRAAFAKQRKDLDTLYEEAAQAAPDPVRLAQLAESVVAEQRAKAERLRPEMAALEEKLAKSHKLDSGIRECFREVLDIAARSLDLYSAHRDRLLALSSDRKPGLGTILRARPISGDIDYADLSREHIARYPKIRAALAK
jgi:hypothetical protein